MEEWTQVKKELLRNKETYKEYKRLEPRHRLISFLSFWKKPPKLSAAN